MLDDKYPPYSCASRKTKVGDSELSAASLGRDILDTFLLLASQPRFTHLTSWRAGSPVGLICAALSVNGVLLLIKGPAI